MKITCQCAKGDGIDESIDIVYSGETYLISEYVGCAIEEQESDWVDWNIRSNIFYYCNW